MTHDLRLLFQLDESEHVLASKNLFLNFVSNIFKKPKQTNELDFSCTYLRKSGHLYVTHRGIYFVSKTKEQNLLVLFEEMVVLEKHSSMFSREAIDIATDDDVWKRKKKREQNCK